LLSAIWQLLEQPGCSSGSSCWRRSAGLQADISSRSNKGEAGAVSREVLLVQAGTVVVQAGECDCHFMLLLAAGLASSCVSDLDL
jgi:hypothetical protein